MKRYDPDRTPDPSRWLELDDGERMALAEKAHRHLASEIPSGVPAHANIHVVVENQIALGLEPVLRAMQRLEGEGLSRHEAVHAIGSVVAGLMYRMLKLDQEIEGLEPNAWYARELDRLTKARWLESGETG